MAGRNTERDGAANELEFHVLTHYEVVVAYHPERREVVTLDPAEGWRVSPLKGFELEWAASEHTAIVALPPATAAR